MTCFRTACRALAGLCLLLSVGSVSASEAADVAAVTRLTDKFVEAQRRFDLPTIRALTAENYVEVSPAGELDDRSKMLGFYAPEKKGEAPELAVENELTRVFGDVAVQSLKFNFTMVAAGVPRKFAIRGTMVAYKRSGEWKLVSAHYTGIRPPQPAPK